MLYQDLKPGEGLDIDNGRVVIRMQSKSGQVARLAIAAEKDVPVRRIELEPTTARKARDGLTQPSK